MLRIRALRIATVGIPALRLATLGIRALRIAAIGVAGSLLAAPPVLAWGGRTHEIINRVAVSLMEEPARSAWSGLAVPLGAHASDADHRKGSVPGERPRHFIDIDVYDEHPFDDVPRDLDELIRQQGAEAVDQWGVVPWAIDECYRMLVLSLERGDWGSAGQWAADLGHYVADSHQPLHCTVNYDGQNSGNDGIHLRFEVHMMDRHFQESTIRRMEPPFPIPENDVIEFCFDWIAEAYPGLQPILEADDAATPLDPAHGDRYHEALWSRTSGLAIEQVSRAATDLAILWTSAWEAAGRPAPPAHPPPFRALPVEELDPPVSRPGLSPAAWLVAGAVALGALILGAGG